MQSKPLAFLAAGAIAVLIAAGCTKGSDSSTSSTTTSTSSTTAPVVVSTAPGATAAPDTSTTASTAGGKGDAAHGKSVFSTNCTGCHGAVGTEGGVGPSLKNEKSRKNFDQTVAWIKNPQPPMPKLFPSPLSEKDVADVAAYVQSL
jgi:mono/diheme cytochrome c family protein